MHKTVPAVRRTSLDPAGTVLTVFPAPSLPGFAPSAAILSRPAIDSWHAHLVPSGAINQWNAHKKEELPA